MQSVLGVPTFWLARIAKVLQFLAGLTIVLELLGHARVENFSIALVRHFSAAEGGFLRAKDLSRAIVVPVVIVSYPVWIALAYWNTGTISATATWIVQSTCPSDDGFCIEYLLTIIIGIAFVCLFLYDPDLPFFLVIAGPFLLSWFVVVLPAVLCLGWILKIAKALLARAGLAQLVFATAIVLLAVSVFLDLVAS